MHFGSITLFVRNPPSLLDDLRVLVHRSTPDLRPRIGFGPEAHRTCGSADCGNSEALIRAPWTLVSRKSRAVDSESYVEPIQEDVELG